MAKQIKRSEIAEKDLYLDIRESAELTITKIDDLNESLSKTATTVMNKLKKPLDETVEGLNDVEESVDAMNKTLEASIKLDKAKAEALQTQRKAEQELEKINQEALKTQQQQLKLEAQELKMAAAKKKADETGIPYGILKKVFDRGMAAWKTGHRPGATPHQWAYARVNSFATKSKGTWGGADKDLAAKVK